MQFDDSGNQKLSKFESIYSFGVGNEMDHFGHLINEYEDGIFAVQ